jgi:hypothetical protein
MYRKQAHLIPQHVVPHVAGVGVYAAPNGGVRADAPLKPGASTILPQSRTGQVLSCECNDMRGTASQQTNASLYPQSIACVYLCDLSPPPTGPNVPPLPVCVPAPVGFSFRVFVHMAPCSANGADERIEENGAQVAQRGVSV